MTQAGTKPLRISVLISGNGSNFQAILDSVANGTINATITTVISNRPQAFGLERAKKAGIKCHVVEANAQELREDYDNRLLKVLMSETPDLIVLAGFMRILTEPLIKRFEGKMLNIHPSLLPKYRGLKTHQRAIDAKDPEHGCSIHFVTPELDGGPVILQSRVPIFEDDSAESLAERVRTQELQTYPLAVKWFCQQRLQMINNKAYLDDKELPEDGYAT